MITLRKYQISLVLVAAVATNFHSDLEVFPTSASRLSSII